MDVSCDSSLPSPPGQPDLYWKRRKMAKVQVLEREIGLLEEELKSLEGLQPASRCCKELDDFVGAQPDPLIAINQKMHGSHCFWKRPCCSCSCMKKLSCQKCCNLAVLSCMRRICSGCNSILHKCTKLKCCPHCAKASCNSCCL